MTMQSEDNAPPVSPEALTALRELREAGEPDPLAELIDTYLADTPERLNDLQRALSEGNAALMRRVAHSLKGSSSNFGADRMVELCRQLEELARDGHLEGATDLVNAVETKFTAVKAALEIERNR